MWQAAAAERDDDELERFAPRPAPGKRTLTAGLAPRLDLRALRELARVSGGTALEEPVTQRLAPLGAELDRVRVHTGDASAAAASGLGARAFTVDHDLHFAAGAFQPDDPFGLHLIAHEVAHTVQQAASGPRVQCARDGGSDGDGDEQAADRAAADALDGGAGGRDASVDDTPPTPDPAAPTSDARVQGLIDDFLRRAGFDPGNQDYSLEEVSTLVDRAFDLSTTARNVDATAAQDLNLAAADHYLTTRHTVISFPLAPVPLSAGGMALAAVVYGLVKAGLQSVGADVWRTGAGEPSRASAFVVKWGVRGAGAGLDDWSRYQGTRAAGKPYDTPVEPGERQPGGVAAENSRAEEP